MVPISDIPIELPNHPGPSNMFREKNNAINAARMYVNILTPRSCNELVREYGG